MKIFINLKSLTIILVLMCGLMFAQTATPPLDAPEKLTFLDYQKQVTSQTKLVLVYMRADWCAVCKRQKPILEEVVASEKGKIELLTIDTEKNPLIRDALEIDALPRLILYKNGICVWEYVGLIEKKEILQSVRYYEIKDAPNGK